jgi:hypothetical protein
MRPGVPDVRITDAQDEQLAAYRPLSGQAVAGMLLALLSPLALLDAMLWVFPLAGTVLCWRALRKIRRSDDAIGGRGMARIGLALSLLMLVAAPTDWLAYRWMLRGEARLFSQQWFDFVLRDQPQKAHQLTVAPQFRQPLDERLWAYYRNNPKARQELEGYVASPTVRTLLALGPKARAKFYKTAGQSRTQDADEVHQLYAILYEEDGQLTSFLVAVRLIRQKLDDGRFGWRIVGAEGGVKPEG